MKYLSALLLSTILVTTPVYADYATEQPQITKNLITEVNNGSYTIDNPLIIVNPYNVSPLTALIVFDTPQPAQIGLTVVGKDADSTIHQQFTDMTTHHIIPVYGLYVGQNKVIIDINEETRTTQHSFNITTDDIPLTTTVDIIKADKNKMKKRLTFVTPEVIVNAGSFAFAFDHNGDIRWVLTDPIMDKMSPLHVLENGTLILGSEEHDPKYTVAYHSLYELDLLGRIHHKIKAEDDIQHDIVKLPNGNYLALVNATGKPTIADVVVELTPDNKVVDRFDIDKILNVENRRITKLVDNYLYKDNYRREKMDAMHLNSLNYDPADDSIIMTARFYNFLIKIDRKTKEKARVLRIKLDEENKHADISIQRLKRFAEYMSNAIPTADGTTLVSYSSNKNIAVEEFDKDWNTLWSLSIQQPFRTYRAYKYPMPKQCFNLFDFINDKFNQG